MGMYIMFKPLMLPQAKELDANTEYYLELLAKGIGKPKEEIQKDIQRPKYFQAQEAIDYGVADKIIDSQDAAFEKRVSFCLSFLTILFIFPHGMHLYKLSQLCAPSSEL